MTDRNAVSIPPVSPEAITAALADATGAGDAALRSAFERLCPSPLSPPAEFYAAARAMPNVPVCDLMRQPLPVAISTFAVGMSAPRAATALAVRFTPRPRCARQCRCRFCFRAQTGRR